MRKSECASIFAFLILISGPVQADCQPAAASNPKHLHATQALLVIEQNGLGGTGDHESEKNKNKNEPHSLFDYLGISLTIVIALAACVQAGAAIWQARSSKAQIATMLAQVDAANVQADSNSKSAEAALKGVVALEKLERPFLMIELRGSDLFKDEIWLVNKGKVPAQILWWNPSGSFHIQSREDMEENMPSADMFNYGYLHDVETAQVINVPWIAPDGEMKLTNFDWINLEDELKSAFQNGQKFFYLLSTVKYRGMLTDAVFESRYCCCWFGRQYGGLRLDGPYGYNSYT